MSQARGQEATLGLGQPNQLDDLIKQVQPSTCHLLITALPLEREPESNIHPILHLYIMLQSHNVFTLL